MEKYSKQGEKQDIKNNNKNDKKEKNEKVDRPVKWSKNKHSFVVAGYYIKIKKFFFT